MSDDSITQMLVSAQKDVSWFESNIVVLKSKFNGKFIAFRNKEIIDYDSNLKKLLEKLDAAKVDKSSIFIEFISTVKAIL